MTLVDKLLETYDINFKTLRIWARSLTQSPEDAEDIMQDVLLHILEMPSRLKHERNLLAFLKMTIRNRAYDLYRTNSHSMPAESKVLEAWMPPQPGLETEELECIAALEAILEAQPQEIVDAFIKHVLYGYRVKDLAIDLNLSPSALTRRFQRMKKTLAKHADLVFLLLLIYPNSMAVFHSLMR